MRVGLGRASAPISVGLAVGRLGVETASPVTTMITVSGVKLPGVAPPLFEGTNPSFKLAGAICNSVIPAQ
jgi:hypothetical protein